MSTPLQHVVPAQPKCEQHGFLHTRYAGRMIPAFIDPKAIDLLRSTWDTQADDIIICTHQKVGTHLTKKYVVEILRKAGVLGDMHPAADGDIGKAAVPWPEVMVSQKGLAAFASFLEETAGQPRIFYTHGNIDELPVRHLHPKTKIVMAYRDPKGAAVSQFHFYKGHPTLGVSQDLTITEFVRHFVQGDMYFGDYHDHVSGYFRAAQFGLDPKQLCIVRFEDLVEDKLNAVQTLSAFLLGTALNEEDTLAVALSTEFNTMKEAIRKKPGSFHFNPDRFFRSGKTEDWKAQLPLEAIAMINAKTAEKWGSAEAIAPQVTHSDNGDLSKLAA